MPNWKKVIVSGSDATLNSLFVGNAITASVFSGSHTGSLFGTSSWASNALTASNALSVATLNQNLLVTGSLSVGVASLGPSENTITLGARDTVNEGAQIGFNAPNLPGGTYSSASFIDLYQNRLRILKGNNTGSQAEVASFNLATNQFVLSSYTSPSSFTGSAAGFLGFDSSGNIITTTGSSAGGGAGSGTINTGAAGYIAYYPSSGTTIDDTSGIYWDAGNSRMAVGNASPSYKLDVSGDIRATGAIYANANGVMYLRGGDDAELWDINVANTVGIFGQQDQGVGSIKLGSGGGTISGRSGSIGIGTTTPTTALLTVNGNVWATSFTGSLSGSSVTASLFGTASWSTNAVNALATASVSNNTLTFTKGNGTQFSLSVSTGSSVLAANGFSPASIYSLTPLAAVPTVAGAIQIGDSAGNTGNRNVVHIGTSAGQNASSVDDSVMIGSGAGKDIISNNSSVMIGSSAGSTGSYSDGSVMVGSAAGASSQRAQNSIFIGGKAGAAAANSSGSVFIGLTAGYTSPDSAHSIGIGEASLASQLSSPYSIALGYYAGYSQDYSRPGISRNNIIIGNAITLPNAYADYANIGGVLFISGTYFGSTVENSPVMSSGSKSNARVGIGILNPQFTLDVSGSGRFSNGLTVTGSLIATSFTGSLSGSSVTASLFGTASWAVSASQALTASYTPNAIVTASLSGSNTIKFTKGDSTFFAVTVGAGSATFPYSGSAVITGSLLVSGSQTVTGSLNAKGTTTLSGSLIVTGSVSINNLSAQNAGYNLQYNTTTGVVSYTNNPTVPVGAASTGQINTPDSSDVYVRPQELETSKHATINIFNYLNFS